MNAERFVQSGRPFLHFVWEEPEGPTAQFSVAESLAGRYRVVDVFAIGEAGLLLLARDERTSRQVVVKAVRTNVVSPPPPGVEAADWLIEELRRARHALQTERRLLVHLRNRGFNAVPHPNDFVHDFNPGLDGIETALAEVEPYLVLERLPGATLDAVLSRIPAGDGSDPGRSMAPAGDRGPRLPARSLDPRNGPTWHVVYQDLKPANILIGPSGDASLLDFGGCQVVINGTPVLAGSHTPGYGPPECFGPPRVLLPCADVFTIGATLFRMLTGIDPAEEFAGHIDRGGSPADFRLDANDLPRQIPAAVREIVASCLSYRPSERIADARQVEVRLRSWLETAARSLAGAP